MLANRNHRSLAALLIMLFLRGALADEPRPIEPADWPMYNRDARGWRFNAVESELSPQNVARLAVRWQFPREGEKLLIGAINATPTVVQGYVYFGTSTFPKFYKLNPDGTVAWTFDLPESETHSGPSRGLIPNDGIYSAALVTSNRVYFGDARGVAYCLDRFSGELVWRLDSRSESFPAHHPANLFMASPIAAHGHVIFGGGAYEHSLASAEDYRCCHGRGFVVALAPEDGQLVWKYDVGPKPETFDPPLRVTTALGERVYHYGPSTGSVWSTPSYDESSQTLFFGTDVHNAPRRPTADDPRDYTPHSAAVIAIAAGDGTERWVTQINRHDIWNHSLPTYDPKTGYKDQSIGDTPKIFTIPIHGRPTAVLGTGCKNGGFYVMRCDDGSIVAHTPIYLGPPSDQPQVDPRTLALPSPIGGLQTGCATDGVTIYTNGIDNVFKGTATGRGDAPPTGGRVTAISLDTRHERWRHERPKVPWVGGTREQPLFTNCGDPVASGIAIANGCLYFTTFTSNHLVVLDAGTGERLKEIPLGPVLAGPAVSRGRVYVGTGNTLFSKHPAEAYYPKSDTGVLYCFDLAEEHSAP